MNIAVLSGLIILVLLVIMLIAGVPIAVALGASSVCAILPVMDVDVAVLTGSQRIFSGISVFSLLAIPFFILAGNIMNKGGIAVRLINLAKLITGRAPGALAQTNVLANMLFGSISGSGTAAASAMGSIIGPIEKEEGYDPNFSAAVNIATAPTGLLIPPSNVMITFSLVSGGTSVAALFMAGYIPGILWGLACMLVVYFIAKKRGYRAKTKFTAKEAGNVILQALPCLLLIVIVIGGIIFGVFTATEGSVVAVVYSLCLSLFVYKSIKIKELPKIFKDSAEMTGIIIFLIGVSSIMSWVMAFTNIPAIVSAGLLAFVVLYNLNNINISERRMELATIKVLGFYDGEVGAYVYRENILLTILGTIAGIILGIILHKYVIFTTEVDLIMFGRQIYVQSYIYSILLTIAFSILVNAFVYFQLKKIDMVESLKSTE